MTPQADVKTRHGEARFGLQDLCRHLGTRSPGAIAEAVGVSTRTVARWAHNGLTSHRADKAAIAVGAHPASIWTDWYQKT